MPTVAQFVDQVDGVSDDVAEALGARYDSVAELAQAEPTDLQEVKGVGQVLADRILRAARTEVPASAVEEVAETTRPVLDVVGDAAGDASSGRPVEVGPAPELPPLVVRLATWVGTTVGWTIRAYRTVTTPVTRLLRKA